MRIAFLFSLGGYKELTQSQEIKKPKTKHQSINPHHQSINRYQKRRKRKNLMQLCKKMYMIYAVNQKFYLSLPILLSFNHFSNYIAIAHY